MNNFISFVALAFRFSTVFLFGATGEIINQKSGHLNMGTPGIMYLGAIGGALGERLYIMSVPATASLNSFMIVFVPVLFAIIFGALGGALYSFFTITLHCNQNVTGLTLTTFGVGLSLMIIGKIPMERMAEAGHQLHNAFPWYSNLGWFGEMFLSQSLFTYLAIAIAIAAAVIISKTKVGLNLRAVGENAAAADAAGVNVNRYRYIATIIGGAIAGIGGAFYELDQQFGSFNAEDAIDAFGWLALCIVICSVWKPTIAILASFGFAFAAVLPHSEFILSTFGGSTVLDTLIRAMPYLVTLVILIITSIVNSKKTQAPGNLGVNYFREDR